MNVVALIGNLTRDPELRETKSGTPVTTLRLAFSGRQKSGEDWVDVPNYVDVTVWGRQAELAAEHLERGRQVAVSGRLQWSEWENEEGEKRSKVEVVANDLQYLAKPKPREDDPYANAPTNAETAAAHAAEPDPIPY